jgi:hypothetical protein
VGYGRNERKVLYFSFSGTALGFAAAHGLSPTGEPQIRGRGRPSYFYFFSWGACPPNPPGLAALEKVQLWHYRTIPERPKGPPPRHWPPEGQRSVTNALFNIIYIVSTVLRWMASELWPPMAKGGRASGWKRRPGLGTSQDRTEESTTAQSSACAKKSQFSNEALFRRRSLPPRSWWYSSTVRTS